MTYKIKHQRNQFIQPNKSFDEIQTVGYQGDWYEPSPSDGKNLMRDIRHELSTDQLKQYIIQALKGAHQHAVSSEGLFICVYGILKNVYDLYYNEDQLILRNKIQQVIANVNNVPDWGVQTQPGGYGETMVGLTIKPISASEVKNFHVDVAHIVGTGKQIKFSDALGALSLFYGVKYDPDHIDIWSKMFKDQVVSLTSETHDIRDVMGTSGYYERFLCPKVKPTPVPVVTTTPITQDNQQKVNANMTTTTASVTTTTTISAGLSPTESFIDGVMRRAKEGQIEGGKRNAVHGLIKASIVSLSVALKSTDFKYTDDVVEIINKPFGQAAVKTVVGTFGPTLPQFKDNPVAQAIFKEAGTQGGMELQVEVFKKFLEQFVPVFQDFVTKIVNDDTYKDFVDSVQSKKTGVEVKDTTTDTK